MRDACALIAPAILLLAVTLFGCAGEEERAIDCSDAISWEDAPEHVGQYATVRGAVVEAFPGHHDPTGGTGSMESAAALLIGRGAEEEGFYATPSLEGQRSMGFVIWIWNFDEFPEPPEQAYIRKTVCVRGLIEVDGYPKGYPWWVRTHVTIDSPADIIAVR